MKVMRAGAVVGLLLAVCGAALAEPPLKNMPQEIGYVEDVVGDPAKVQVIRNGAALPVTICMTIHNDDVIRVSDARYKVIVRLAGRPAPVERTINDNAVAIHVDAPPGGFVNSLVKWASVSIGRLDAKSRSPVAGAVRAGEDGPLAAAMFKDAQDIGAGRRSLWIGWQGAPSVVMIELSSPAGKPVLTSRATKGLWQTPPLDLHPGAYRILVKAGNEAVTGTIRVVPLTALPQPPADLKGETIPPDLRRAAQAAWLASQGSGYMLEALQLVAASAEAQRPAGLLADAFIAGTRLDAPP